MLRTVGRRRSEQEEFWALRDIEFEVEQGETFAIIGHNGAGKSTLLKILSRITPPTTGEVTLNGRVGALLEVGTGFNPELTGRENVFLNGAILGMTKVEIENKFEQIVDFAGVERFIDTPVKRYSSGMQLRLAFSVAAHLEPEILIVDEVLSVGDLAFQEKCLGRMETVAGEGRTVLFVSHNLTAVRNLCERGMLLSGGRTVAEGTPDELIDRYARDLRAGVGTRLADREDRTGNGDLRFTEITFDSGGREVDNALSGQDLNIVLGYESKNGKPLKEVDFGILVSTRLNELMISLSARVAGTRLEEIPPTGKIRCTIPRLPLPAGQYALHVWAEYTPEQPLDWIEYAHDLTVVQGDFFGSGREPPPSHRTVFVEHAWSMVEPGDLGPVALPAATPGEAR